MKQDWTEQLRQRLEGYEEPAPEGLWEAIEQRLQEQESLLASQERTERQGSPEIPAPTAAPARRVPLRRWLALAASVLVLLTVGVALLFQRSEPEATADAIVAQQGAPLRAVSEAVSSPRGFDESTVTERKQLYRSETEPPGGAAVVTKQSTGNDPVVAEVAKAPMTDDTMTKATTTGDAMVAEGTTAESSPLKKPEYGESRPQGVDAATTEKTLNPRRPLTVGLRGANLLASNGANAVSTSEPIFMARSHMSNAMYYNNAQDFEQNPVRLIDYADDTEHQFPLTVGLAVSIPLTDRLWVETGLSYTRAKSSFTTRMGRNTAVYHQRLQYLGVPVGAGYTFWQSRCFSAYAAAGGQADVNVDAHLETDGQERRVDKDRLLLSVGTHAGAEYRFLPHIGVYVEPGLRYYFDNGSRLKTVFKDKPLQFDLQVGLRYTVK